MKRNIAVNHNSCNMVNEKHPIQDFSISNLEIRDRGIGNDIENNHESGLMKSGALKADINCVSGGHKAFCEIVDRALKYSKFGHHVEAGAGKTDDVKMKRVEVAEKCYQDSATVVAGDNVKKRSSCRTRSDAVNIDCHLFKIEIPNVLAEFITAMNGCLCQYICKKANIQKMTVSFTYGKSNGQKLFIYGNENGMKYTMKLLKKIMSRTGRASCEKNTVFVRPKEVINSKKVLRYQPV